MSGPELLQVDNLSVSFPQSSGLFGHKTLLRAVDEVSFTVVAGESVGVVGASGSGKSTLAQAVTGLVQPTSGTIKIGGRQHDFRREHGVVQMVFQDPQTALNPRRRIRDLIVEPLVIAGQRDARKLRQRAEELAEQVGVSAEQLDRLPRDFSGGQRQRIAIARALALRPQLLVLDEPTSALDVSVQAQILNLLLDLQQATGIAYLFISHDIAVVRHLCSRVLVMKSGRIVESGATSSVLASPAAAYTRSLLAAAPTLASIPFRDLPENNRFL